MTDREMLELAAKAAGIVIAEWSNCQAGGFLSVDCMPERRDRFWNPLTDDGDALRLAVALQIDPMFGLQMQDKTQCVSVTFPIGDDYDSISEPVGTDPYAATRRAITRAAAEIGRTM